MTTVRAHELPEFRSWLSAADAVKLLEITHACISCTMESDFKALFPMILELLSFDHACATSARLGPRGGVLASRMVNVSCPEEFCFEYLSRDYFLVDPVMRDALTTGRAQYCCDTTPGRPSELTSLCRDFGVREGYILGSKSPGQTADGSLFGFKSPSMKQDGRSAGMLEFIAPHLHLAFSRVVHSERAAGQRMVTLSSREREVLAWLQHGKSSWDVSAILGISESTVNFHVHNITKKLGAANRPQALAIAAHLGLLGDL